MVFLKKKKDNEELAVAIINQKLDNLYNFFTKLYDKMLELEEKIKEINAEISIIKRNMKIEDVGTPLTKKTKELIKILLKKHGKLTAQDLANLLNLSRTRCSEYLVEMEESGEVKSVREGKKKYYFLAT
ncbi:MAG: helix-turn-helix domain-containing protein [Candidatus Aenigmatarchaeota archaeon]